MATPKTPKHVDKLKRATADKTSDEAEADEVLRERHRRMRGTDDGSPIVVDEGEPDELLGRLRTASVFDDDENS